MVTYFVQMAVRYHQSFLSQSMHLKRNTLFLVIIIIFIILRRELFIIPLELGFLDVLQHAVEHLDSRFLFQAGYVVVTTSQKSPLVAMNNIIFVPTQHHNILPGMKIFLALLGLFLPHLCNRFCNTLMDSPSKVWDRNKRQESNFLPFEKSNPFSILAVLFVSQKIILVFSGFTA